MVDINNVINTSNDINTIINTNNNINNIIQKLTVTIKGRRLICRFFVSR